MLASGTTALLPNGVVTRECQPLQVAAGAQMAKATPRGWWSGRVAGERRCECGAAHAVWRCAHSLATAGGIGDFGGGESDREARGEKGVSKTAFSESLWCDLFCNWRGIFDRKT